MLAGSSGNIASVRICVPDVAASRDWYAQFLNAAPFEDLAGFAAFRIGTHRFEIVRADGKNPASVGGTIVYWQVHDLDAMVARAQSLGGRLYRGPLDIGGVRIAQVMDPHGSVFGLSSPAIDPPPVRD